MAQIPLQNNDPPECNDLHSSLHAAETPTLTRSHTMTYSTSTYTFPAGLQGTQQLPSCQPAMQSSESSLPPLQGEDPSISRVCTKTPGIHDVFTSACILVEEALRHQIVHGMYINFSQLLSSLCDFEPDYKHYMNVNRHLNLQCHHNRIDNFMTWLKAWNVYEHTLVVTYPALYPKLATYRQLIQQCDKKFTWQAVLNYDEQFRCRLAARNSLEFDKIDITLYTVTFDCTAIKSHIRCFRCKSTHHEVKWCPFQEGAAMAAHQTAATTTDSPVHEREDRRSQQ